MVKYYPRKDPLPPRPRPPSVFRLLRAAHQARRRPRASVETNPTPDARGDSARRWRDRPATPRRDDLFAPSSDQPVFSYTPRAIASRPLPADYPDAEHCPAKRPPCGHTERRNFLGPTQVWLPLRLFT